MEIITLVIGLIAMVVPFVHFGDKKIRSKNNALALVVEFRKQWDEARIRNNQFETEELFQRGLETLKEFNRPLRRSTVWLNRNASRELNALGKECERTLRLMTRKRVSAEQWPELSGAIGRQLAVTIAALG